MVLLASALGLGPVIGLSSAFGGDPAAGLSLPGSDSQQAGLLEERFPAQSGDRMDVVVHANAVTSP
jgi:RND superfamily putative drug exporter